MLTILHKGVNMKKYLLLLMVCLLGINYVNAEDQLKASHTAKLFPANIPVLNIEPYIPANYILAQFPGKQGTSDEFFWAPEGVLENLLKNEKEVHVPFIHIIAMSGFHSQQQLSEYLNGYKNNFPDGFEMKHFKWGTHEVTAVNGFLGSYDLSCLAFVPLNDTKGTLLMFQLMYSKKTSYGNGNKPAPADLKFWEEFLKNTH